MRTIRYIIVVVMSLIFYSAGLSQKANSAIHEVEVLEIDQVSSYTYILVQEGNESIWIAAPKFEANVGDVLYYQGGMEMRDFKSAELDKTFESVIFISSISKNAIDLTPKEYEHNSSTKAGQKAEIAKVVKLSQKIKPVAGSISIAELLENKKQYAGKTVKVTGQVMKYNAKVMSKNWIHLQDGTTFEKGFDITLTTNMKVNVGDIVCMKGLVSLDKDFGYGYLYGVIIENAVLVKE